MRSLRHYHLDAILAVSFSVPKPLRHAVKAKAGQEYARYHALVDAQPRAIRSVDAQPWTLHQSNGGQRRVALGLLLDEGVNGTFAQPGAGVSATSAG